MPAPLRHGALAGLAGGASLALVLLLAGEGPLQRAIDLEAGGNDELVSRTGQRVGGVVAALLVGVVLGLVFSAATTVSRRSARSGLGWPGSLGWASLAFAALHLVPLLKYPPNPPGIGESDTVGRRTALFLILLAWSLMALCAGGRARRWLERRDLPDHVAWPGAVLVAVGLVLLACAVLPAGPDPDAVPASIVWSFRMASIGGWAAYWAVTGTVFAWLSLPPAARRSRSAQTVAAPD